MDLKLLDIQSSKYYGQLCSLGKYSNNLDLLLSSHFRGDDLTEPFLPHDDSLLLLVLSSPLQFLVVSCAHGSQIEFYSDQIFQTFPNIQSLNFLKEVFQNWQPTSNVENTDILTFYVHSHNPSGSAEIFSYITTFKKVKKIHDFLLINQSIS